MNAQTILEHYLVAALWTEELDSYSTEAIGESNKEQEIKDIDNFVEKAGNLLNGIDDEQIGHDFWLTRQGHGAGFWDRELGEVGDKLSKICEQFKEINVWKSELDIIYFE